jgi:hypothetical protein
MKINLTRNKRSSKKIGFNRHTLEKLKLAKKSIQNESLS